MNYLKKQFNFIIYDKSIIFAKIFNHNWSHKYGHTDEKYYL